MTDSITYNINVHRKAVIHILLYLSVYGNHNSIHIDEAVFLDLVDWQALKTLLRCMKSDKLIEQKGNRWRVTDAGKAWLQGQGVTTELDWWSLDLDTKEGIGKVRQFVQTQIGWTDANGFISVVKGLMMHGDVNGYSVTVTKHTDGEISYVAKVSSSRPFLSSSAADSNEGAALCQAILTYLQSKEERIGT